MRLWVVVSLMVMVVVVVGSTTDEFPRHRHSLFQAVLREQLSPDEEREAKEVPKAEVEKAAKKSDYTGTITKFAGPSIKSVNKLTKINWNQDPGPLIKSIGDAIVPLITIGLAFIPVVGPIIAGLFGTLWEIFSPYLEEEKESMDSKMTRMIDDAMKKMERKMDDKLKTLLSSSIRGELERNKYVCDKYSLISAHFTEEYKKQIVPNVNDTFRLEMILFLDNCDNFLKDTAEAFVHPQYADVLWLPSAITTLTRAAFLADVLSYGSTLRIPDDFLRNYFYETKHDIRRHLTLHSQGIAKRLENVGRKVSFSLEESALCKLQSELLFLDRHLYPFGVPRNFTNKNNKFDLNEKRLTMAKDGKPLTFDHIQVLMAAEEKKVLQDTDQMKKVNSNGRRLVNCYMGRNLALLSNTKFHMKVSFLPNYAYTIRVIYFTIVSQLDPVADKPLTVTPLSDDRFKAFVDHQTSKLVENNIAIRIRADTTPAAERDVLFEVDATYLIADCAATTLTSALDSCPVFNIPLVHQGKFVIDEVTTLNINSQKAREDGQITVTAPNDKVWLVGVELLVQQKIA